MMRSQARPLSEVVSQSGKTRRGAQPTINAEQLRCARNEAAAAERRRVGEVLAGLTAAGAVDGDQAEALVQVLTNPTTGPHNAVARYEKQVHKNAAGAGAAIAKLYHQTTTR